MESKQSADKIVPVFTTENSPNNFPPEKKLSFHVTNSAYGNLILLGRILPSYCGLLSKWKYSLRAAY